MGIFLAIRTFVIAIAILHLALQWAINNTDKSNEFNRDPSLHIIALRGL